jgi:hypothetical protein
VPTSPSQVEIQPGPYDSSSSASRKTKSIQEIYMAFKRYIYIYISHTHTHDGTQRIDFDDFSMLCLFANYDPY